MRYRRGLVLALCLSWSGICAAQQNQFGVAGGFGFYHDATITNPQGAARAGFCPRFAVSAVLGHRFPNHLGAELRYTFQDGDSELRSGSVEANLDAHAHSIAGELLWFPRGIQNRWQPFVAAGFGMKTYQATEAPAGPRPLANFATLANCTETRPLLTFGAGVTCELKEHWLLRADVRNY